MDVHALAEATSGAAIASAVDPVERQPSRGHAVENGGRDMAEHPVGGLAFVAHCGEQGVLRLVLWRRPGSLQIRTAAEPDEFSRPPLPAQVMIRPACGEELSTRNTTRNVHAGSIPLGRSRRPLAERAFRLACQDITELLLDPTVSGRRRVASLDEPEDALAVLRRLGDAGAGDRPADARSPLVMLRISSLRLRWVANREVVNTRSGTWNDDSVVATHRRLLRLQDELTRAVEAAPGRPTVVLDVPESAADYDDSERDTTDEDFDTYVTVSGRIREWSTGLRDMGPPAG